MLRRYPKEGACIPHSAETYDGLRTFVHGERGAMAVIEGSKADRVMSLALANAGAEEAGLVPVLFA